MYVVEIMISILLLCLMFFLTVHAVIWKIEETRVWNRKRIMQRRAKREAESKKDS